MPIQYSGSGCISGEIADTKLILTGTQRLDKHKIIKILTHSIYVSPNAEKAPPSVDNQAMAFSNSHFSFTRT